MSSSTTVLGLTKPASAESVDISILDTNFDTLDAAIGAKTSKVSTTTVATSTTETVVHTHTIAANAPAAGSVYRAVVWGQAGVTGTPTLTYRVRLGGLAGTAVATLVVTAASGVTGKSWRAEGEVVCITTGAGGTWQGSLLVVTDLNTTLPSAANVNVPAAAVSKSTTASCDLVVTVQWSASSASNTCSALGGYGHRVTNS